jgi:hypothetical protein
MIYIFRGTSKSCFELFFAFLLRLPILHNRNLVRKSLYRVSTDWQLRSLQTGGDIYQKSVLYAWKQTVSW